MDYLHTHHSAIICYALSGIQPCIDSDSVYLVASKTKVKWQAPFISVMNYSTLIPTQMPNSSPSSPMILSYQSVSYAHIAADSYLYQGDCHRPQWHFLCSAAPVS